MSDPQNIIFTLESFLKELQCAKVIKEFSLQSFELNQDNLNEFESIFTKFTQEVNNVLTFHKKTVENSASQSQKVSDMNCDEEENQNYNSDSKDNVQIQVTSEEMFHKKTIGNSALQLQEVSDMNCDEEENQNYDSDSKDNVQIQVTSEELKRRIDAFKLRKRRQKDERYVQEYCGRPYIDELNPLWGEIDSCARVDAVFIPRFGIKSRVKVSKVKNIWGPQTEAVKQIKIEPESDKFECTDKNFEAIQERLLSMESHLKLKSDDTVRKNFFIRIKELEDRILYLEGISPDYFNLPCCNYTSSKQNISEKEKMYSSWSIDDVQRRIQFLRDSLKSKSAAKKIP